MSENTQESTLQSTTSITAKPQTEKEWALLEKVVLRQFEEQKKTRFWNTLFKFGVLAYLVLTAILIRGAMTGIEMPEATDKHTALVDVQGMIADGQDANADSIVTGLREAFENERSVAVVLRINSPGGSPVQSGIVYREMLRLRKEYPEKKLYAAITDVGASGAYYIAAAADEIYADPASIVGSIGVISDGFGFVGAMEKLGVERRIYNAGGNKAMLDPFSPVSESQVDEFQTVLKTVHQQFIDAVKTGRGDRLQDNPDIFSGLFWSGEQALPMGLIDGLGSPGYVAREIVKEENIVDYSMRRSPFQNFADRLGVKIGSTLFELMGLSGTQLR